VRTPLAALGTAAALSLAPASAAAATVQVTTQTDENNGCAVGGCSLREAISAAGPGGAVTVPPGMYATNSELVVSSPVTIDGAGPNSTIVTGGDAHRVFHITAANVTLRELQVAHGKDAGGGDGAGIWDESTTGRLTLDGARVTANSIERSTSGGVAQSGGAGIRVEGPLTVKQSEIDDNFMSVGAGDMVALTGGGGLNSRLGPVTMTDSEVHDNTVQITTGAKDFETGGGGIFIGGPGATLDVARSTIAGNRVMVQGGTYEDNGGGGIYDVGEATTLTNSTLDGNTVSVGAAIADNGGGGIYTADLTATLTNVTISNNSAVAETSGSDMGGAIYRDGGSMSARNTILAGNLADVGENATCFGAIASKGHNIEDTNTCGLHGAGDRTSTPVDLGPLAFNGGPTRTRAIFSNGPAFNAAGVCPARDQRGVARPRGPRCDIGAYEIQVPNVVTGAARPVTTTSARLRGTVVPSAHPTTYFFRYGRTKAYGRKTVKRSAGAGTGPRSARGMATGLEPATRYHFRLVATNALGATFGGDRRFITRMRLPAKCVRGGQLTVPLQRPAGTHVVSAKAFVDKKQWAAAGGSDLKRLKLNDLPDRRFRLRVVAALGSGEKVLGARRYKPCS
jgi:CSLREA domain-containing protein